MADLIPVIGRLNPEIVDTRPGREKRGLQRLLHNRLLDEFTILRRHHAIQQIIPDRQPQRDFGRVQKVLDIPVIIPGDVSHFLQRLLRILLLSAQQIGERKNIDPEEHFAGDVEHPETDHFSLDRLFLKHFRGMEEDVVFQQSALFGFPVLFETILPAIRQKNLRKRSRRKILHFTLHLICQLLSATARGSGDATAKSQTLSP